MSKKGVEGPPARPVRLEPGGCELAPEPILREIERRGVHVGIGGRLRLEHVLSTRDRWTPAATEALFAALLATDADGRRVVQAAVRDAVAALASRKEAPSPARRDFVVAETPAPPLASPLRVRRRRVRPGFWVAAVVAVVAAAGSLWLGRPSPEPGPVPVPDLSSGPCPVEPTGKPDGRFNAHVRAGPGPDEITRNRSTPWWPWGLAILASGATLAVVLRMRHVTRLRPLRRKVSSTGDPSFTVRPPAIPPLLTDDERERLVWGAGRYVAEEAGRRLDVRATVEETARRGGEPSPRWAGLRRERDVWVLVDREAEDVVGAACAEEVVRELGIAGVPCRHLVFDGIPDRFREGREDLDIEDLEDDARHAAVLVFTDGARLSPTKVRPEERAALRQVCHWPRVAFVASALAKKVLSERIEAHAEAVVLAHEQAPTWLSDPEWLGGALQPPKDMLVKTWRTLCVVAPFEPGTRLCLELAHRRHRECGDVPRPLHLPFLMKERCHLGRLVLPPDERRECEASVRGEGSPLLAWAYGFWAGLLEAEAKRQRSEDPRWLTTPAARDYEAQRAKLGLTCGIRTSEAVRSLVELSGTDLHADIEAWCASRSVPVAGPVASGEPAPGSREWELLPLDSVTRLSAKDRALVAQLPVVGRERLPQRLRRPLAGILAASATAGIAVGAVVHAVASAPVVKEALPAETPVEMISLTGGRFCMGSPASEAERDDDEPRHVVRLKGFSIAKTETTVGQYRTWLVQHRRNVPLELVDAATDLPATQVNWDDAKAFCEGLRGPDNLTGFSLPTEAQWEFATRAGTQTRYFFGDSADQLDRYAWFDKNSERKAHAVALKEPNPWGLHDVLGNAWEWLADWYADDFGVKNRSIATDDPHGPSTEPVRAGRVLRGGAYWDDAWGLRSAYRGRNSPVGRFRLVGFRCAGPPRPER